MKFFLDGQKGYLIEEESVLFDKKDDFFEKVSRGVKVKGCTIRDDKGDKDRYLSFFVSEVRDSKYHSELVDEVVDFLSPHEKVRSILCCGIGNPYVTCDSLGSETVKLMSTRRVDGLKLVVAMPYGLTGIQSKSLIRSLVKSQGVDMCIIIDSLCTRSYDKIGKTFQFTDSGIVAGSAVGGDNLMDDNVFGVPVIAVGVPTVIRSSVDINNDKIDKLLTPTDVKSVVDSASNILSEVIIGVAKRILR